MPGAPPSALSEPLSALRELVATLRTQCPWDARQDARSMRPYLLEESHEVLEAIDEGDAGKLAEELGDLLFQVFFLARLLEEKGQGDIGTVAWGITEKMVARHPHVFSDPSAEGGPAAWEARKAAGGRSRVGGIPPGLPALAHAWKVGQRLHHVGFDWADAEGAWEKVEEEKRELWEARGDPEATQREFGDLLLSVVSVGRHLGVSPEDALREANKRLQKRFERVEAAAAAEGVPVEKAGLERLEAWWQAAKKEESR